MILESAILNIRAGESEDFERAFKRASPLIASTPGYVSHDLLDCVESPDRYLLLVRWETLEAHIVGFRQSEIYKEWKALLHHFYDPFPVVEHFHTVLQWPVQAD